MLGVQERGFRFHGGQVWPFTRGFWRFILGEYCGSVDDAVVFVLPTGCVPSILLPLRVAGAEIISAGHAIVE